ncbi:MAG: single-stranded-DNA-specific exonuclease RecJ [Bacteroidota bacterium]
MRWTIKPIPEQASLERLSEALGVAPLVAQLLLQRGVKDFESAKTFFRPQLSHLHDPFLMKDMDKAVTRITNAISTQERILVYGDYDVDGTTAVALVATYLQATYPNVATYIPDRYGEGYGVSKKGIDFASDNDITLIIALDCGIKAIEQVAYAKTKGIDFIICDHHRPGSLLPEATAVLDPKREDCHYPYDGLCGCGVGFKLIQALADRNGETITELQSYLDLVATAIAADIVPITGENRVLAYYGMQVINSSPRTGFKAIIDQFKKRELTITDVVFMIAPRINAAGRMEHGQYAVNLLMERDIDSARQAAAAIDRFNTDRQSLDHEITQQALAQIKENKEEDCYTSVVFHEEWHKGVIGIVASRMMDTYYRPTLVFTKSGQKLAASARSVKGFDVYEALGQCSEYIEQFGGHKYAAGLTLLEEEYTNFKKRFEAVVSKTIDRRLLSPEITVDASVMLSQLTPKLMRILKQFAPFGPGNMKPVFMVQGLQDTGYAKGVGEQEKHLKMTVTQGGAPTFGAIGFNLGDRLQTVGHGQAFDAAFTLEENEWNGITSLQLKVKDLK